MELTAALEAVRALPGPLVVVSDSKYVVDCFVARWYVASEKKGWKRKGAAIPNLELWRPLIDLVLSRGDVTFEWVRGHSGDPMNDIVDRLATEAAATQVGRSGTEPPTELGPADEPNRGRTAAPLPSSGGLPEGYRVVILGHRPPQLGGYDANPVAADVLRRLTETLIGLVAVHPDLVVLTGLGLGAEQLGAAAATAAGVRYVAVLGYPRQEDVWPTASQLAYQELLAGAAGTVNLSGTKPATRQQAGMAIGRRNEWLTAAADGALVVWDGLDPSIRKTVTMLERRIPDDTWVIPPPTDR